MTLFFIDFLLFSSICSAYYAYFESVKTCFYVAMKNRQNPPNDLASFTFTESNLFLPSNYVISVFVRSVNFKQS